MEKNIDILNINRSGFESIVLIYGIDSNGDVSLEVGVYKDGKPIFN